MYLFGLIKISDQMEGNRFVGFWIKIDSIYWNWKKIKKECTSTHLNRSKICQKDKNLENKINISSADSKNLFTLNMKSINNVGGYLFYDAAKIATENLSINITFSIGMGDENIIDYVLLENIKNIPNSVVWAKQLESQNQYLTLNLMHKHNCIGRYGENCKGICYSIPGISTCDEITGKMSCIELNGNTECLNTAANCNSYISKERKCIGVNNPAICICDENNHGTLQHNYICDEDCNGVGTCVGPNKCMCISPYMGDQCDEYHCEDELNQYCNNKGICIYRKNSIMCRCPHPSLSGLLCEEVSCNPQCVNGICMYIK
ncbi:hypothetical protein HZS_6528, partial [Henneguya salminicola]